MRKLLPDRRFARPLAPPQPQLIFLILCTMIWSMHWNSVVSAHLRPAFSGNCPPAPLRRLRSRGRLLAVATDEGNFSGEDEENDSASPLHPAVRYRGRVAYDGSGFSGWQTQSSGRTVQVRSSFFPTRRSISTTRPF